MKFDVTELTLALISCKSISGEDDGGAINLLQTKLEQIGFKCMLENFSGDGSYSVSNLYAETGTSGKNLCFAGHTDVVPTGDESLWSVPPFQPKIVDGYLIGRGAVDMKGGITAWVAAVSEYLDENKMSKGKLSLLITGDEEADSINGTVKMLESITKKGVKIDSCIVGEPTSNKKFGDMMKVGRRGSISFKLTVQGKQGHAAYPEKSLNPNTIIIKILNDLITIKLDSGNEYFQSSNLEVTSIDVANPAANIIPDKAVAKFNIRFNDIQTKEGLTKVINDACKKYSEKYTLETRRGAGDSFITKKGALTDIISRSIEQVVGITPEASTCGGTSDARFIKNYAEVVEFGLMNYSAHKIDEKTSVEDLVNLKNVYKKIIENYFA